MSPNENRAKPHEHNQPWIHVILAIGFFPGTAAAQGTADEATPSGVATEDSAETATAERRDRSSPNDDPSDDSKERSCRDHGFALGSCRERRWTGPELMLGADFGISAMTEAGLFGFNSGVGGVTGAGPSWNLRAGVELLPWLGLEARYVGMYNAAQRSVSPGGNLGYLTTGAEAVVRITAPIPYVRPYVFAGIAYYDISLTGSSRAQQSSVLQSSSQPGLPLGFGIDIPLTFHLSVDFEATDHIQIGEDFSTDKTTMKGGSGIDVGDISTFNAGVRIRL